MNKQVSKVNPLRVTTPAYYTNAKPHIGHVYSNVLANWFSSRLNVPILSGADTHGKKVREAAGELPVELFCRNLSLSFLRMLHRYSTSNYEFKFTDSISHKDRVTYLLKKLLLSGYVVKGTYSGYYDASEETFYDEPGEGREWVSEPCLYLNLKKLRNKVKKLIESRVIKVYPRFYLNKVMEVMQGVDKLCLTRKETWGIKLGKDWTVHVWVDALLYYLSDLDLSKKINLFQVLGKDILSFHSYYWPCLLVALGYDFELTLLVTPWLTSDDQVKLSKSKGNFTEFQLLETKPEILRLYLLSLSLWKDNVFSVEKVKETWNLLGSKVGNLVNRFHSLSKGLNVYMELSESLSNNPHVLPNFFLNSLLLKASRLNFFLDLVKPWSLSVEVRAATLRSFLPYLHDLFRDLRIILPNLTVNFSNLFLQKSKFLYLSSKEFPLMFPKWD